MVTDDWTPEEEEAWQSLCQTKEQTLHLARTLRVAEIYVCSLCGEPHVRSLPSSAPTG